MTSGRSRGFVVGALLAAAGVTGYLASACFYDFEIPGDDRNDGSGGDAEHTCAPNDSCKLDCLGGNCEPTCGANSTCSVNCTGGNCHSYCGPNATCTIACIGGNCHTTCDGTCKIDCLGGGCRCEGRGCP